MLWTVWSPAVTKTVAADCGAAAEIPARLGRLGTRRTAGKKRWRRRSVLLASFGRGAAGALASSGSRGERKEEKRVLPVFFHGDP